VGGRVVKRYDVEVRRSVFRFQCSLGLAEAKPTQDLACCSVVEVSFTKELSLMANHSCVGFEGGWAQGRRRTSEHLISSLYQGGRL
jgi:hypothetical protein